MRVVVFGAGAIGSALGGMLALKRNEVTLVGRKEHVDAINKQKGIKLRSTTGEYFAELEAVTKLGKLEPSEDTCILFTPKSNSTRKCVDELADVVPDEVPIVSFQNGIANEEMIAERFENVYGGVCRMTCSLLHPGRVTFRRVGRIIIGKYPKGVDPFARKLAKAFEEAGLQSSVSRSIMCDKWLKLVVSLQSTLNAIVEPRDHDTIEFMKLKIGVIEEAKKVLKADKIRAKSCDGRDFSLDEMMNDLRKPRAQKSPSYIKVNNSTWQNLYLKRKDVENEYFHGPIIELGKKHGVPVPFNETVLAKVLEAHKKKLGPEAFRAKEILDEIEKRKPGK
jgi:2-dehydropantoate 2-reductase